MITTIEELHVNKLDQLIDYLEESYDEDVHSIEYYNPYSKRNPFFNRNLTKNSWHTYLMTPLHQPSWRRILVARNQTGKIVGEINFRGNSLKALSHRTFIGMSILEKYRNQKIGHKLLEKGITWVKETNLIDWIDLGVFSKNARALHLYQKFNFSIVSHEVDYFRVDGHSIDHITMTLALR